MKRAFGMFALTRAEQRAVALIICALLLVTLVKHYRETGTVIPTRAAATPRTSATPASFPDEERAEPAEAR